jgi:hypothetical protein
MWEAMIELAEARGEMLAELEPNSSTTGTRSAT